MKFLERVWHVAFRNVLVSSHLSTYNVRHNYWHSLYMLAIRVRDKKNLHLTMKKLESVIGISRNACATVIGTPGNDFD